MTKRGEGAKLELSMKHLNDSWVKKKYIYKVSIVS